MFMHRFLYGFKFLFLWDKCLGVWLLSCMVSIYLVFLGNWGTIFQNGCIHFTFPTAVCQRLSFPTSSKVFRVVSIFYLSYFVRCVVIDHHDLNLRCSGGYWCWISFHVPVSHLYFFFGKMSIQVFCSFFESFVFFWYWVIWPVYIFWNINPSVTSFANIFSRGLSFHFVSGFLCCSKAFKFN